MELASLGVDIGKTTFHLVGLDPHGKAVVRKKCSRKQLLAYTARLEEAADLVDHGVLRDRRPPENRER